MRLTSKIDFFYYIKDKYFSEGKTVKISVKLCNLLFSKVFNCDIVVYNSERFQSPIPLWNHIDLMTVI